MAGKYLERRIAEKERAARHEISLVTEGLTRAEAKKELHLHAAVRWMHHLSHAAKLLLEVLECEIEDERQTSSWIWDTISYTADATRLIVGLRPMLRDSRAHMLNEEEFVDNDVFSSLQKLRDINDKILTLIPRNENLTPIGYGES